MYSVWVVAYVFVSSETDISLSSFPTNNFLPQLSIVTTGTASYLRLMREKGGGDEGVNILKVIINYLTLFCSKLTML